MIEAKATVPYESYWVGQEKGQRRGKLIYRRVLLRPRGRHTKPIWRIEKWWMREIWGGEVMHITRAQAAQAVHRGR